MVKEITLQQGLDHFRKKNVKYFSARPVTNEGKKFLLRHDICR